MRENEDEGGCEINNLNSAVAEANKDDLDAMLESVKFKMLLLCFKSSVAAQMYTFNMSLIPPALVTDGRQFVVCDDCQYNYSKDIAELSMGNAVTVDIVKTAKYIHDNRTVGMCKFSPLKKKDRNFASQMLLLKQHDRRAQTMRDGMAELEDKERIEGGEEEEEKDDDGDDDAENEQEEMTNRKCGY